MTNDAKKIEAVIARLASEHEGEVIAAARALKRMAEAKGKKLWEFIVAKEEQRTAANESVWAGFSSRNYYQQSRAAREAQQKYADEQARKERQRKQAEREKAAKDIYEEMKAYRFRYGSSSEEDPFAIFKDLKREWDKNKGNWQQLRERIAEAVARKGSDHLTTWEKEFLLDMFARPNLSPQQRQKIEQIAKDRYGL